MEEDRPHVAAWTGLRNTAPVNCRVEIDVWTEGKDWGWEMGDLV
jgi:hypothetical protein